MQGSFKKKLLLLLFLFILFIGFIGLKFLILDSQSDYGRLKIKSIPSAVVFINNAAIGKTPFEDKYKIGEYLVKLIPEAGATETASWQGKVKIYKNALTYINRELGTSEVTSAGEILTITKMEKSGNANNGEVYVETDPIGAIVYLDNDEKAVAPLVLQDVPKGDHELSVFMPNFLRRTIKINTIAGYRTNVYFKLALDPNQPKIQEVKPQITATPEAAIKKVMIVIGNTPTGFLRVREEPSINASESARVKPGDKYDLLDEQDGWYKIKLDTGDGWVYGQYATKQEQ